jgi:UDP-glucuronate decarboxylase
MNPIVEEDLARIHDSVGDRSEWNDAVVLITGCAGFLGFYLTRYLLRYAAALKLRKVIGLDNFLLGKPDWLTALEGEFSDVFLLRSFDVSKDKISSVVEAGEAHYVIHGASVASPTFYRKYPVETIDANIWGLRLLLDHFRNSPHLKGFLFFSSSEIYGDPPPEAIPTNEDYWGHVSCVGPRACYDESKRFGETLCSVFAKAYEMPITAVRPFNNYGPGMRLGDRRLPADLAECIMTGRDLVLLSDGCPTRTYCYISDAVAGYFLSLLHGRFDYFNIGTDSPELTVRELAEIFCDAGREFYGYDRQIAYEASRERDYLTDNPTRRCPDITKARRILGYDPKVNVQEGVRRYLTFLRPTHK